MDKSAIADMTSQVMDGAKEAATERQPMAILASASSPRGTKMPVEMPPAEEKQEENRGFRTRRSVAWRRRRAHREIQMLRKQ